MVEIALLHHVVKKNKCSIGPQSQYSISPSALESYLESRKSYQSTLPDGSPLPNSGFLITFDDGYRNNLTEALPVLEKYSAKAIIFITTGFIDGSVYPYEDEMAAVIEKYDTISLPSGNDISAKSLQEKKEVYERLRLPLKAASAFARESYMQKLASLNSCNRTDFQYLQFLSWDEIVELDRHPLITIGAHTESHLVLPRQAPWKAYQEIKKSKRILEQKLGHAISYFSYPYGGNNYLVRKIATFCGYEYAFTTEEHICRPEENSMALPRIEIGNLLNFM
jgi:peptidoglycan/xylan/chitin deacetylase (PgdA/CDA1 family)